MEERFDKLTSVYLTSAREYFYILRLAIYHVNGVSTETSFDVVNYLENTTDGKQEIYRVACEILKAIN